MKGISIEKALAYLYYDDETLSPEEMVELIVEVNKTDPSHMVDWIDGVHVTEAFENSLSCETFVDSIFDPFAKLKLAIDDESINIYIDNGDDQEPTHIVYWHLDEFEEDATVCISALNAVHLFYSNPQELLTKLGIEI